MRLEFHQLDRRWEHLRVHDPHQHRHLLASLAENGQQTPIVVVAADGDDSGHYVVIDGYKRIAALQQLGRDTVEATLWSVSEAEALLLDRSLRRGRQETALEEGWLLAEMEQRFRYSLEELARRFDRSLSWVSRRLALIELLPEVIQQQIRGGKIPAQMAMRYLVPVARVSVQGCEQLAAAFISCHCDSRQAGQLYAAWRDGTPKMRERILAEPALFLKTQRVAGAAKPPAVNLRRDLEIVIAILQRANRHVTEEAAGMDDEQRQQTQHQLDSARRQLDRISEHMGKEPEQEHAESIGTDGDSGTERQEGGHARDRARHESFALGCAQSHPIEFVGGSGDAARGEGRAVPRTDPRAFGHLQGESRASP
jgi:ParB family transcriptional regulator, chromosome partitioning protein